MLYEMSLLVERARRWLHINRSLASWLSLALLIVVVVL